MRCILTLGTALLLGIFSTAGWAQSEPAESESLFPTNGNLWINSPPLTAEMLKGKGVFLWFFDEQCPRCRGKWPEIIQVANSLANEPVIFVAVNSGNTPADVAKYARSVGLRWPVLADFSREFEAKAGVGQISLQNIWQAAIITPRGELQRVNFDDIPGAVRRAAEGASWKVDPARVPAELKPAWRAIELGEYASAAASIMKHRASSNEPNKQAAEALYAVVEKDLKSEGRQAWQLGEEKKYVEAYLAMTQFLERFKGYDVPEQLTQAHTWLGQKEEVRNELQAAKILDAARPLLDSPREALQKRGVLSLQNVVKRFPGTQAAEEAGQILAAAGVAPPGG